MNQNDVKNSEPSTDEGEDILNCTCDENTDLRVREMLDMDRPYFVKDKDILKCTCGNLLQAPIKQVDIYALIFCLVFYIR